MLTWVAALGPADAMIGIPANALQSVHSIGNR